MSERKVPSRGAPLLAALLLSTSAWAQQATAEREFDSELSRLQRQVQGGSYAQALDGLQRLLQSHAEREYARRRRVEVEMVHRRCAFRLRVPQPDPKDLVSGELLACDLQSGAVKIRYPKDRLEDWRDEDGLHALDLRFVGPHVLEVRGSSYQPEGGAPAAGAVLFCCREEDRALQLRAGVAGVRGAELSRSEAGKQSSLGKSPKSPLEVGKPFRLQIRVGETGVRCLANGELLIDARKPTGQWGTVAFGRIGFDDVVVEGRAEPAWLQARIDAARQDRLRDFERRYDPRHELPAWLWMRPTSASVSADRADPWPDELDADQMALVRGAEQRFAQREYEGGLRFVRDLLPGALPEATATALQLGFLTVLDRYEEAGLAAQRLGALAPEAPLAVALRAELQIALGHGDQALQLLAPLADATPRWERLHVDLTLARMTGGELVSAKRGIDAALARGVDGPDLGSLNRTLVKALQGPDWAQVHWHRTAHFEIASDIDTATCRRAAELLEAAQAALIKQLGTPAGDAARARVFLFAGPEGFQRYLEELWGTRICPNVSGLYHPLLKQLLVCNLPRRDEMLVTIRHEGVHQFLDRLAPSTPVWLNEGLACCFEHASLAGNVLAAGPPDRTRAAWLASHQLVPLADLLARSPEAFYADTDQAYAQSEAFVGMLLEKAEHRRRFELLLKELAAGALPEVAQRKAFAGLRLEDLDLELAAYVRSRR